jgi:hypothetical protein
MSVTASTLLVVLGATALDLTGSATLETMVGQSPVVFGEAPEKAVAWTLIPAVELRARTRASRLSLEYAPRLFWRYPNALDLNRPVLLHSLELVHDLAITRRLHWTANVTGSVGEVDYTSINQVFATPQSSPVATDVLKIKSVNASASLAYQTSFRSQLSLGAFESYSSALTSSQEALLPEQSQTGILPGYSYLVTRFDTLLLQSRLAYQSFSTSQDYFLIAPEVGWAHVFNRSTDGLAAIGASHVRSTEDNPITGERVVETSPSGRLGLRSWLYQRSRFQLRGTATTGIEWFFDPIRALSYPQATAILGLRAEMPPRWTAGFEASFATSARSEPLPDNGQETVVTVDLPVTYLISDTTTFGFGARGSTRGPHLSQGAPTEQLELWGYVSLRVVTSAR